MSLRVCVAGVTGWTGRELAAAVRDSHEFELVAAVARREAGRDVGEALGWEERTGVEITADPLSALSRAPDVWIDYTHPLAVKDHALTALEAGTRVVIGTSGLGASDYGDIEAAAVAHGAGVIAAGNFSLTAACLKHLAGIASRHLPHREIVDYADAGKPDAPSGTAMELAEYLDTVASNRIQIPVDDIVGVPGTRGAGIAGTQVHSVRLPGYVISVEVLFGLAGEHLTIRHDAGESAEPYVAGTLLAVRRVGEVQGLVRGLDRLLFG